MLNPKASNNSKRFLLAIRFSFFLTLIFTVSTTMADKTTNPIADAPTALIQKTEGSAGTTSDRISEARETVSRIESDSERAEWWSGLWASLGVFTAIVAALLGAAAYWQSSKENNINERLRKADHTLSDLLMEEQRMTTAFAAAEASKANQGLAQANLEIESRKNENLSLSISLEEERIKRLKIERTLASRASLLTPEVIDSMRTALSGMPEKSIAMKSLANDQETRDFAGKLESLLQDLGYLAGHGGGGIAIPPPVGTVLEFSGDLRPELKKFSELLIEAGVPVELEPGAGAVNVLSIGVKQ